MSELDDPRALGFFIDRASLMGVATAHWPNLAVATGFGVAMLGLLLALYLLKTL